MTEPLTAPHGALPMYLSGSAPTARLADITWRLWAILAPLLLLLPCAVAWSIDPAKPIAMPSAGATDWATNPQAALQLVMADNQRLVAAVEHLIEVQKTDWMGYAVGALGLAIGALKVFNGPAGALAEGLWAMLAPKLVKDAEKKRDVMADGFLKVAEIMRSFPPNTPLGSVIDKLDKRLPEAVKIAYREWEAHEADDRPDAVHAAPVVTQQV